MAITHPQINPVALDLGVIQLHWYGLMYLLAFGMAYFLAWYRTKSRTDFTAEMVSDLVFFGSVGVILGGRIGYVILYNFGEFIANPLYLFRVWEGGMSFHGGFVGVLLAMWYFAYKYKKAPFTVLDFIAPCVPTGLLFGRIGNFINGELWGRVSTSDISHLMYFPQAANADFELLQANPALQSVATNIGGYLLLPRHPSQLYQAATEGVLLFILLWWFSSKPRPRYAVSALFLLGYGISRFITEFFRQPDVGYELIFGWMSKGQLYSLPMIIFGIILMVMAYQKRIYDWKQA
ncbi:prolipoprotein diacylglyceryl transferase [Moraxella pluranimalium]|uniref:Phosphatidylglycerol--prolipoprotein diacylglyceryl transferase n=1 Tax=Moraxella pluranimalium TaxID=470453 RepID=A0A1T0CT46_9GAMM|nr:prolipoprotein diacylglyceryl transferase [Moraxella pluranimalium]OOS25533.1 prolipoprotein diacylglyceryl transferase [Moraxella pluranimalium]